MKNYSRSKILYSIINASNFRFQSDLRGNAAGFHLEYNSLQPFSSCGGYYSNASGVLSSPSYPNPYPDLADCVYLISQPNGSYIKMSFLFMDINCTEVQTSDGLTPDFIEMRDGNSEDSPLIARFCSDGSNINFIQTTQNHLRIR